MKEIIYRCDRCGYVDRPEKHTATSITETYININIHNYFNQDLCLNCVKDLERTIINAINHFNK